MKKTPILVLIIFAAAFTTAAAQEQKPFEIIPDETPGYYGQFELGFLYGETNNNFYPASNASPSLQLFNGYRFHRLLAVGGTLGFDFYQQGMLAPVALGLRGNILKTRVSPFYSLDAGYGFTFIGDKENRKSKGGWMFNPAIGLKASNKNNTALTFSLGYKTQQASSERNEWNTLVQQKLHYKRMSVRLGYMF